MKYLNCYEKISIHTKTWHFTCYINYTLYENVSQTSETFMLCSNVILSRLNLMSSPVNLNYLKYLNWYMKIWIHTKIWYHTHHINHLLYENIIHTSETFMLCSNVILPTIDWTKRGDLNLNYLKYLNWYKKILISSVCFVFLLAMWVPIDLLPPIDGAVKTASVSTITCTNRDTMQSIETYWAQRYSRRGALNWQSNTKIDCDLW